MNRLIGNVVVIVSAVGVIGIPISAFTRARRSLSIASDASVSCGPAATIAAR